MSRQEDCTGTGVGSHLEKLKMRGIQPDMIIVDYGDLLKPISKIGDLDLCVLILQ